jgi:hypothetical protein
VKKDILIKALCFSITLLLFFIPSVLSNEIQINNNFEDTSESNPFPDIKIKEVNGGTKLSFIIENEGNLNYHNIEIITRLTGGLTLPPKVRNHEIILLTAGGSNSTKLIEDKIFGFGTVQISIGVKTAIEEIIIGQIKAFVIGPFIIILNKILNEQNSYDGYTLYTPEYSIYTYLINNAGEVVHSWNCRYIQGMATYLLENGNLIRSDGTKPPHANFLTGGTTGHVGIYAPDGTIIWDFTYSNEEYCLHHDIEVLPNGNILMSALEYIGKEEAIQNGKNPENLYRGWLCPDKIIEVKPTGKTTGEIIWEWHVWDHIIQDYDPTKENYGDVENHPELIDVNFGKPRFDWNHINSIDYNEELDQILLCSRELSEIWIIDHSTTTEEAAGHTGGRYGKGGDLLYRWGNPQVYRAGGEEDKQLFEPHDAEWIEPGLPGEGNILIFNNQRELEDEPDPNLRFYSSVDEIIPPINFNGNYIKTGGAYGPNSPTWIYYDAEDPHSFFSSHLSGAQRLPNGNTLICDGGHGNFFEVTPEKGIVWEYYNSFGFPNHVFEIHRYSPDYPGIQILLNQ